MQVRPFESQKPMNTGAFVEGLFPVMSYLGVRYRMTKVSGFSSHQFPAANSTVLDPHRIPLRDISFIL